MRYYGTITKLLVGGVMLVVPSSASANAIGFQFSYVNVDLDYTFAPGPGGKIGELTLSLPSFLTLSKFDLGVGGFGGGDDVLLDLAIISDSGDMLFALSADVIQLGSNDYLIQGTSSGSDVDMLSNSHELSLSSLSVGYAVVGPTAVLSFNGLASTRLPNDSILINRPDGGNDWVFVGEGVPNPGVDPDEDGTEGTVTLATGVEALDDGSLAFYHLGVDQVADLDAFFSNDRFIPGGGDLKINIIPEATTLLLLALGGWGLLTARRRR